MKELREEGTKHPIHHYSGYPHASLGPLNAYIASIKDLGMDPLGPSDLCPYALGCLSAQWVITPIQPRTRLLVPNATPVEGKGNYGSRLS